MFGIFIAFIFLGTIYANPTQDTTDNPVNKLEISTMSTKVLEDTTGDQLVHNQTMPQLNVTSVPMMTTAERLIPNSTAQNLAIGGKLVTYSTTYNYYDYTSANSSDSGLSGGAIAGIIIGVIVLLCCCGICGFCGKEKGHWENAKVWVRD